VAWSRGVYASISLAPDMILDVGLAPTSLRSQRRMSLSTPFQLVKYRRDLHPRLRCFIVWPDVTGVLLLTLQYSQLTSRI